MSSTTFTASHPLAIKVWSRKVFNDAVKATMYGMFTGSSDRAVVQVKTELKGEGDRVRFGLRSLPQGYGVQDDEVLEGNEEGLDFRYFDLNLGEKRHAVKVDLNLSAQRTMFDVKSEAKDALQEWLEEYLDTTFFEYLTGASLDGSTYGKFHRSGYLGGNSLLAPSADRIIYGGTGVTAKNQIAVTDIMTLAVLDKVAERLKLANPTMRKAVFNGKKCWVVVLHPYQVNDLRANTSTLQWGDIVKAAMAGGGENSFEHEVLGMYRDMLLVESVRVPTGTDAGAGGNIAWARALVLGAQAAVVAHGKDTDDQGKMKVVERTFDYGKKYGIAATLIWGLAKTRFSNQSDFGCFMIDTAAKAHN